MDGVNKRIKTDIIANQLSQSKTENLQDSIGRVNSIPEVVQDAIINQVRLLATGRLETLRNLRLVSKEWLLSVSRVLRHYGDPLFHVNFPVVKINPKKKKLSATHFFNVICQSEWNQQCLPPFLLSIRSSYFKNQNYDILSTCVKSYEHGLVKFAVVFDNYFDSANKNRQRALPLSIFHDLSFPVLQSLAVCDKRFIHKEENVTYSPGTVNLINTLINRSKVLKKLTIFAENDLIEKLALPATISNLEILGYISKTAFSNLADQSLVNLRALTLCQARNANPGLFTILNQYKKSLRCLKLIAIWFKSIEYIANFRFPVMEKLETLTYNGRNANLMQEDSPVPMQKYLPELTNLTFEEISGAHFTDWTQTSIFSKVKCLTIDLIEPPEDAVIAMMTLGQDNMGLLHTAFPNVIHLTLRLSLTETTGLEYLFENMTQLKNLALHIDVTDTVSSSDFWDALLIGTNVEFIRKFKISPDSSKTSLIEGNQNKPSIQNLRALEKISVMDVKTCKSQDPLISDMVITHAFLKMERLRKLHFSGRFVPTQTSVQKWISAGRLMDSSVEQS